MATPFKKLIVILGPTATGKTRLAVALARRFGGEIISADSRQVYRGMDIGTGKDLQEYVLTGSAVKSTGRTGRALKGHSGRVLGGHKTTGNMPYHLIDIIQPMTPFNVAKYQKLAYRSIEGVLARGKVPILCGGTGLYIDAVTRGYEFGGALADKELKALRNRLDKLSLPRLLARLKKIDLPTYKTIDRKNRRRVQRAVEIYYQTGRKKSVGDRPVKSDYDLLIIGVKFPLAEIYRRIDSRLETRIKEGMIKEIKKLRRQGVSWKRLEEFGLEYRYVSRYLRGLIGYREMLEQLRNEIHHFAKRQLTWFKRNKDIVWVNEPQEAERAIDGFLKKLPL
ncbi:MAG: tRNA (adenosine(37)-N6)-dimethylallyltransferase MiaA [Patescibacteria group bacterium]|jgi:tRNA dimethylallyltransferase